jgi:hypothetical protein
MNQEGSLGAVARAPSRTCGLGILPRRRGQDGQATLGHATTGHHPRTSGDGRRHRNREGSLAAGRSRARRNLWHGHLTQAQGQDGHARLGHATACPLGGPSVFGPSSVVLPPRRSPGTPPLRLSAGRRVSLTFSFCRAFDPPRRLWAVAVSLPVTSRFTSLCGRAPVTAPRRSGDHPEMPPVTTPGVSAPAPPESGGEFRKASRLR